MLIIVFIREIDVFYSISEDRKSFQKIHSTFWLYVIDRKGSVSSDFFDRFRSSISVLRYDKEPCFRGSIDDRNSNIGVLMTHKFQILSEPFFISIQSMWRIKIYKLYAELFG
jgi:hypothetical protein